jgi:hypothetical protein
MLIIMYNLWINKIQYFVLHINIKEFFVKSIQLLSDYS